jgi:hypothetical protein
MKVEVTIELLPFRANRLANIIAGGIMTLVNGFLTFVAPLTVLGRPPAYAEYLFFGMIETICTSVIIWQAWTWSGVEAAVSSKRLVRQPEAEITFFLTTNPALTSSHQQRFLSVTRMTQSPTGLAAGRELEHSTQARLVCAKVSLSTRRT